MIAESHDFTRFMLGLADAQQYHFERKCRLALGDSKERYIKMIEDNPTFTFVDSLFWRVLLFLPRGCITQSNGGAEGTENMFSFALNMFYNI